MHLMRESWTDARLDDLNSKVDRGFEQLEERFEKLERRIEDKFDAFYKFMLQAVLGIMAIMVGGFATLLAAVILV